MFSLPSLAPQDSYTLWYTSSSTTSTPFTDPSPLDPHSPPTGQNASSQIHRRQQALHQRTPLSRLRADEEIIEARKHNIQNYGSLWIKPPGVGKSLHQQREEKRELEEHNEALRREALAQELAEAEAGEGIDELLQGEGMDGEAEVEVRDLDDDVPDADADLDPDVDNDLLADSSDEEDDENDTQAVPRNILTSRLPDEMYRAAVVRGTAQLEFGASALDEEEEEDASHLLQEDDLVHEHGGPAIADMDLDMDADLDADVPEAEDGYEHTDTEAELSSSSSSDEEEDEDDEIGSLPTGRRIGVATSMVRSDGTQNSLDLSSVSMEDSSSPRQVFARRRGAT